MSRQSSRDTAPEVAVRKLLHAAGLRYRVNVPVPGMPRRTIDIVFGKVKIAIFMDGCFWHGCPIHATQPKANAEWWRTKLDKNMARDWETTEHLRAAGWTVLRYWEHESPETVAGDVRAAVLRLTGGEGMRSQGAAGQAEDDVSDGVGTGRPTR
ncbi:MULTISPECIES: very short patch repair endonuclease [unclassified Streptomyces]|uniref:very short patch repair endonuclease n=1 Tax=unclassified Streptomyces TaxID=2593676 RepID=UPI0006901ADC|nr:MULTISPECIES: very short patch repair endonuclease [unclassified Streptomyces]